MTRAALAAVSIVVSFAVALAAAPHAARADLVDQRVAATVGLDPAVVARFGWQAQVAAPGERLVLVVPATFTLPMLSPGGGDGELKAGVRAEWRARGPFVLRAGLQPFARVTQNDVHAATGLGFDLELTPGLAGRRGFVGLELGWDRNLLTHIEHTQRYRDRIYADAVDGWYQGAGGSLRAGVRGELRLGRVELRLRVGVVGTDGGHKELLPAYLELGAGFSL